MKMKAEPNYQPLFPNNISQFSQDEDEGGLDFGQILAIIRRQSFLIAGITFGVAALAVLKAVTDPPMYQGQFEILIEPTTIETEVISATNPDTLNQREDIIDVRDEAVLKVLKSPELINPIVDKLQIQFPVINYSELTKKLKIKTIGQELQVVTVSYQSGNQALVKSVLEEVSQAYIDYSRKTRESDVRRGMKFVDNQLPQLRQRVRSLEAKLQKIRQDNNLVDPEIRGKELAEALSGFGQEQLQTQIQLEEAREVYTELQNELARQSVELAAAPTLNQSPRFQNLLNQLQEIDSQIARDSVLFFDESPEIRILKEQRERLIPLVRQEAQKVTREKLGEIKLLETRGQILNDKIGSLNTQLKELSGVIRDYTEVQRELVISNDSLNKFLSERESLLIDISQTENPWRLLVAPDEPKVITASLARNLLLGIFLGLLLGIGLALLIDKSRNRLYTIKEVRVISPFPILGVIPFAKELSPLNAEERLPSLSQANERSYFESKQADQSQESNLFGFREAFRSLYTNLRFTNPNSSTNSFIISSATPGEGKSTIAIYLAQAAATLGQRVLLVDTDLRYPSLHSYLSLSNEQGLTDILAQENLDINPIIQRSPLEDNLFILTSGSVTSLDPTKLLASTQMQELMQKLEATFDLVIYKAPHLSGLADTPLLANNTDGVLLVVSLGKLKGSTLEQALDKLSLSNTRVLGLVGNHTS